MCIRRVPDNQFYIKQCAQIRIQKVIEKCVIFMSRLCNTSCMCQPHGCHRVLFNQPDFAHVDTILEATCDACGFQVLFLPKFHCELNFIEQCWEYAKQLYCLNPESTWEDQLEKNALTALDAIPLISMQQYAVTCIYVINNEKYSRFVNRSCHLLTHMTKG